MDALNNPESTVITVAIILVIFALLIFFIRSFGAWMLRIDEIIKNQKEIIKLLQKDD